VSKSGGCQHETTDKEKKEKARLCGGREREAGEQIVGYLRGRYVYANENGENVQGSRKDTISKLRGKRVEATTGDKISTDGRAGAPASGFGRCGKGTAGMGRVGVFHNGLSGRECPRNKSLKGRSFQ